LFSFFLSFTCFKFLLLSVFCIFNQSLICRNGSSDEQYVHTILHLPH
jgi:hypothetical protein